MVLGIVETAARDDVDPMEVARVHFALGERLGLPMLVARILALPRDDRWQTMARAALRDDLHAVHAQLTAAASCAGRARPPEQGASTQAGRATLAGDLRRRGRRPGPDVGGAAGRPLAAADP